VKFVIIKKGARFRREIWFNQSISLNKSCMISKGFLAKINWWSLEPCFQVNKKEGFPLIWICTNHDRQVTREKNWELPSAQNRHRHHLKDAWGWKEPPFLHLSPSPMLMEGDDAIARNWVSTYGRTSSWTLQCPKIIVLWVKIAVFANRGDWIIGKRFIQKSFCSNGSHSQK